MSNIARHPKRVHIWQPVRLDLAGGGDGEHTVTAPEGYRVVSGGYQNDDPANAEITASWPVNGATVDTPDVLDGWLFKWRETGTITNSSVIVFHVLCERDDEQTLVVVRDDPNAA